MGTQMKRTTSLLQTDHSHCDDCVLVEHSRERPPRTFVIGNVMTFESTFRRDFLLPSSSQRSTPLVHHRSREGHPLPFDLVVHHFFLVFWSTNALGHTTPRIFY